MKLEIPDFKNARVLVVGDVMLDYYWHGSATRISPEAPVPIVKVDNVEKRPGGAGNVALNIASLGCKVNLIGMTGNDSYADEIEKLLSVDLIDCYLDRQAYKATITKFRVISQHQQLIRLDLEDGFGECDMTDLKAKYISKLKNSDLVVLSDYGKGTLGITDELISLAQQQDKPILVDPKGSDFSRYTGCSLITPNLSEFEAIVGKCHDNDEIASNAESLKAKLNFNAILVTVGEHGMILLNEDNDMLHLPTHARDVYDVTGAGDTVISVLAASLAAGHGLQESVALSNLAAGIVVSKLGAVSITLEELRCAIEKEDRYNVEFSTEC